MSLFDQFTLRITLPDGTEVKGPSAEWSTFKTRWQWQVDSWEGGDQYRNATYGTDSRGLPIRNLVRHKREYPDPREGSSPTEPRPPGSDQYHRATENDDYQLRLARTPVPTFVADAIETHLSKIFRNEVDREARSSAVVKWWEDVDGRGSTIDRWMSDVAAPLLLALGQLDLLFERPPAEPGAAVQSRADVLRLGLDGCTVSVILPGRVVWHRVDRRGRYRDVLISEMHDGKCAYRYWSPVEWVLYRENGERIDGDAHPYGRVPAVRLFDRRRPQWDHVGLSRYEAIAELQREFYNRDSELILSDTTQAHPLLQAPEEWMQGDRTIPIGPGYLLPMKFRTGADEYQGFEYVDPPKGAAESIRANKADIREAADRSALLTKPAGSAGTGSGTVSQSGISKQLDQSSGNDLLAKIAGTLETAEAVMVEFVGAVTGNAEAAGTTTIRYPRRFDLWTPEDLAGAVGRFQDALGKAGNAPETEAELLCQLVRTLMPGFDDDGYERFDGEIKAFLSRRSGELERERGAALRAAEAQADEPGNAADDDAGR